MMATGTKGLTLWCKNITKNYGDGVETKNMTSSWKNGLAFCAILHHYRPDLIDFSKLSKENIAENNALAFRVAEEELGIPALLDVEDMVNMRVPDRLSIMTYVSQYYNYFKDKIPGEIVTHRIPSKKRPNTESIESVPSQVGPSPGKLTIRNASQISQPAGTSVCFSCGKTVYLMERLSVEGKLFHRVCFKCLVCQTQLKTSTYEFDKNLQKFFCEKDFKERGKKRDDPDGKENTPEKESPSKVDDVVMADVVPPSINTSPFKRNEQFVRKGIRPESSPADMQWEKAHVIKSKEEELKSPTSSKSTSKAFFSGLLKKKTQSVSENEFANPSYQQHIDLSNFMNQLNSKESVTNERVVIGAETTEDSVVQSEASKGKSPKKKKLVLKVKKKKGTHKNEDGEGESRDKDVAITERKEENRGSNYENIEVLDRVLDAKSDPSASTASTDKPTEEERHYAEPSSVGVPVQKNESGVESANIYLNVSTETNEKEENSNPLLLAAKNRLRSSGRRKDRNVQRDVQEVEENTSSQYLAIRGNLKKVRSAENVNEANLEHPQESNNADRVGQAFLEARAKLHKTGVHDSEDIDDHGDSHVGELKSMDQTDQTLLGITDSEGVDRDASDRIASLSDKGDGTSLQEEAILHNEQNDVIISVAAGDNSIDGSSDGENIQTTSDSDREKLFQDRESHNRVGESPNININGESPHIDEDIVNNNSENSGDEEVDDTVSNVDRRLGDSLNPFITPEPSPRLPRKSENTNPFLSSNEDLLFEESDEGSEFDQSNPFAEDVRLEKRATSKKQNCSGISEAQLSVNKKKHLLEMGIDETNPFADDLDDEETSDRELTHRKLKKSESVHVPNVVSHMPATNSGKKLVLKTKHKKRSAPVPPQMMVEANSPPTKSNQGTFKKRQAPQRPSILKQPDTDVISGNASPVSDDTPAKQVVSDDTPAKQVDDKDQLNVEYQKDSVMERPQEHQQQQSSDAEMPIPNASTPTQKTISSPFQKRVSEKRKAPVRPVQPDYDIDEEMLLKSVALRDKQPKRDEMEKELELLEVRQRQLEMDGVMMEKKLRGCDNEEPEEAYLLTWFELVNQKNLLLRRENELIYLCQEQDFLRNQRRAEFELRRLMNKPEKEKTIEDRMREDQLLADILNYVTRRSNIINQMDEDRLREYEEDLEINNMLEAQGLSSPPSGGKVSSDANVSTEKKNPKKKEKKKKEKNKKKKSVS